MVEFGWKAMRPENWIDTVIAQWLEGCGIIQRPYMKQDEIAELGAVRQSDIQKFITDNKLMTENDFLIKYKAQLSHDGNGHKEKEAPQTVTPLVVVAEQPPLSHTTEQVSNATVVETVTNQDTTKKK